MIAADPALRPKDGRAARWILLAAWLLVASFVQFHHAPWRDEVRALSLATQGTGVLDMLRAIHGEGHPALWYLLLRGGHALIGNAALPVLGFAIGAGAAALLALCAPLRPAVLALALLSGWLLFDDTAIARNYGLGTALMFLFAALYPRCRDRGVALGVVLFLLCNANAPCVLLAAGLLLFWAVELVGEQGLRWTPAARVFALNAALAAAGALACALTVYPPFNDAVDLASAGGGAATGWRAWSLTASFGTLALGTDRLAGGAVWAMIVVGAVLSLARRPAGLAAGIAGFVLLGGFLTFVFSGAHRHQALLVAYLLTVYWLVAAGRGGAWASGSRAIAWTGRLGEGAFLVLLALQVAIAGLRVADVAGGGVFSHSREVAALLRQPALAHAAVIAEPDLMLEPLPYYVGNPLYLVREHRWGNVVAFTRAAQRTVSLGEMLATARAIHARSHRPVMVVLAQRLDPDRPALLWPRGYLGAFSTTPAETRAFLAATTRIARFGPAETDESYDVYVLKDGVTGF